MAVEETSENPTEVESSDSDSVTINIPRITSRKGLSMVGAIVILLTVIIYYFGSEERDTAVLDEERVMVAPFENRTGDKSLDPLGRTAADWITEGIAQAELVETVPSTSILHRIEMLEPVGGGVDDRTQLQQLAEETESSVVISGSFIQLGDVIQLQARIIEPQTGNVTYTVDPIRGSRSEPMEAVEELRRDILSALSVHVFPDWDLRHFGNPPTYEAHLAYWEGMEYYGLNYQRAFEHFKRALEIDPDFVRPKLFMAIGYMNLDQYAQIDSIVQELQQERDQLSPYDKHVLDWIAYRLEGKTEESLATLLQLEEIAPRDAFVNFQIGSDALQLNRPRLTVGHTTRWRFRR